MLTYERQQVILSMLEEKEVVKIQELVDRTNASESTIRRDLTELENKRMLKRIHGGASLISKKLEEPTLQEKSSKFSHEKDAIGKLAGSQIKDGDCLYIDAGTTTEAMIPYIKDKDIVVVTNGLNIISALLSYGIKTYVVGGYMKEGTRAIIGRGAINSIATYQFDFAFIGSNGLDLKGGYTTPDPEEAMVKNMAIQQSNQAIFLVDHSKFGDTTFAKIADLQEATMITSDLVDSEKLELYGQQTQIKVVNIS